MDFHRFIAVLALQAILLVIFSISRFSILVGHRRRFAGTAKADLGRAFLLGARADLIAAGYLFAPVALAILAAPRHMLRTTAFEFVLQSYLAVVYSLAVLGILVEYYYFQEYGAKLNHIFIEYLRPSSELATMLWKDYPILRGFGATAILTAGLMWPSGLILDWAESGKSGGPAMFAQFLLGVAWIIVGCRGVGHRPVGVNDFEFSNSNILNQLAANSFFQLSHILYDEWHHGGRVAGIFGKISGEEAEAATRRYIATPDTDFVDSGVNPLDRIQHSRFAPWRPNVVLVLMESHAASHIGALGAKRGVTPCFDRIAKEGVLFTRIYASGDRTARGIEAVLSSFPPLPGLSILKRMGAHGQTFTLASHLRDQGYRTQFYYGGDAAYDSMRGFMLSNGFERTLERRDIKNPVWETSWGISDENIYALALENLAARSSDEPLFAALLTISNHRPYTWPPDRFTPLYPDDAVRTTFQYADFAMGEFIEAARKTPAWQRTVFIFVADHGSAIHGRSLVPVDRFHIPLLILAPGLPEFEPRRIDTLASQLDTLPTLLACLGGESRHCGFGRNLFELDPARGSALMHYHGAYAYLRGDEGLILKPGQKPKLFEFDRSISSGRLGEQLDGNARRLTDEVLSMLTLAERLHRQGRYQY